MYGNSQDVEHCPVMYLDLLRQHSPPDAVYVYLKPLEQPQGDIWYQVSTAFVAV